MIKPFRFRVTHIYRRAMARIDLLELGLAISLTLFLLAVLATVGGGR